MTARRGALVAVLLFAASFTGGAVAQVMNSHVSYSGGVVLADPGCCKG